MHKHPHKITGKLIAAIVAAGLMSFSGVVSETAMNVTFPTLMKELNINTSTVQWLTTGYLLVLALVVPLSSYLKRRFKMRSLFLTAIFLFTAATILCALAPNFQVLLTGRLIQGAASGIALPLMFNIVLEQAPKAQIGFLMGVASLITAMAPALGPVLGGLIVDSYGWRVIFWVLVPVLLISFLLGSRAIRQSSELSRPKFNLPDYLLLVAAFSVIFATEEAAAHGWLGTQVLALLAVTTVTLFLFVQRSPQNIQPLINIGVFKNPVFVLSLCYLILTQFSVLALGYLIPNYSQIVTGNSASLAGLLLLPGTLCGAFLAPYSGRLLDRFGAKKPILSGSLLIILSLALFALFGRSLNTPLFMLFYVIFAVGQGFSTGNTMTNGLRRLPKELAPDGNAVVNTLQQLSGAVGTSVAAAVVASAQHKLPDDLPQGTMLGSENAFILICLLSLIAFGCVYRVFKNKAQETVR